MRCPYCREQMWERRLTGAEKYQDVIRARWQCDQHGHFIEKQPTLIPIDELVAQSWDKAESV